MPVLNWKGVVMWVYRLRLESGEDFYYDNIKEARFDKMQFGGAIDYRTGKEVF